MSSFWTVISVSTLVLLTACASPGGQANVMPRAKKVYQ